MIDQESHEAYKHKVELVEALVQLNSKEKEIKSSKGYGETYFWSFFLPPLGLYNFVKYLFFTEGEKEKVRAGIISLILALASLFISFWIVAEVFKQTTISISSHNFQMLKDLVVPDNQKKILKLYR